MPGLPPAATRLAGWLLLALGAAASFWAHAAAALGAHPPDISDGAVFLLQAMLPARGLVPYREAGFPYPPGVALILGDLLGTADPPAIRTAAWTAAFAIALANAALTWRLAAHPDSPSPGLSGPAPAGAMLLLMAVLALFWGAAGTEPFTPGLTVLLLLATLLALRTGATPALLGAIALAALLATLFRWDRAPTIALLLLAVAAALALAARRLPDLRRDALRLAAAAAAMLAGTALAWLVILAYAAAHFALAEAIDWILAIPLATLPASRLPPPWPVDPYAPEAQWIAALLALDALLLAGLVLLRPWRAPHTAQLAVLAVLLAVPLALLPHAFSRADAQHFLPLSLTAAASAIAALALWPVPARLAALVPLLLLALPLAPQAARLAAAIGPVPRPGHADEAAAAWTAGCTQFIPPEARALFVGQRSYRRFALNAPLFHVVRPDLRPATAFIAESPGLQNTCRWGERIARQLADAPRPMVALLDTEPQPTPPGARPTRSCRHIETALRAMPRRSLGRCPFAGRTLRVWLYE